MGRVSLRKPEIERNAGSGLYANEPMASGMAYLRDRNTPASSPRPIAEAMMRQGFSFT